MDVERKENSMAPPKASLELYGRVHNVKFLKEVKEMRWSRSAGAAFAGDEMAQTSHPVCWGLVKLLEVEVLPGDESHCSACAREH